MLLAAGHSWRPERGLGRWTGALIVMAAVHTGAVAAGLLAWESIVPPMPPAAAIMLELAPTPAAPQAPVIQAAQEPPPPAAPSAPMAEPEPLPDPPIPLPPVDPVPPTTREPEVALPKPAPEKPKIEQVVEAPKKQPKEQPKEKRPEQPKQQSKEKPAEKPKEPVKEEPKDTAQKKPKPVTKPDPKADPTVGQDAPLQPAPQAAPAAAPVQQAAVPAAPSAADIARRANAEANWQGLLLAHLEKHKKYPKSARKRHEQGTSFLQFRMNRDGTVLSYALARSSGHEALDEEVLAMITRAQPLPTLPAEMTEPVVEIVVPVQFTLR